MGKEDGRPRTCPSNYAFRGQSKRRIKKYIKDIRSFASPQRHLGTKPSAARCCPLTAGPGGSLPSPGAHRGPAPPPSRPAWPSLIVASPSAGSATSGCALLSSSPLHTNLTANKKKQQPATTQPSPPPPSTSPELAPSARPLRSTSSPGWVNIFPQLPPRRSARGVFGTHAHSPRPHAPLEKQKIREAERKGRRRKKPDRGAQTWESPPSGSRGRGGQAPAARDQLSGSGEAPQPAVRAGPAGILGADPAAWGGRQRRPPPHRSGLPAEAERRPLPHETLKARTRGSREVQGRATPRTATEGRCPPTIPRNSPVIKPPYAQRKGASLSRKTKGCEEKPYTQALYDTFLTLPNLPYFLQDWLLIIKPSIHTLSHILSLGPSSSL
ncbi:uncharacterized protein RBU33_017911 [Hipposideros larvatus]